jgi:DDE superfamily endonuclease/Helix-turn-helix of DDE superfamily endonuclease
MYHTTGLTKDEITELCAMVYSCEREPGINHWPPILGLFKSIAAMLTYARRNRVQAEIAEAFGVSQPTISRAVSGITPLLAKALAPYVPTAEDLDENTQYIVDGTLLPCWSWATHPELYSGKHKTTGMNVQVACTLSGNLAWISDPVDGRHHDSFCLGESGVLLAASPGSFIGDKGYVGNNMITPVKKREYRGLLDWEKEFNTQVNKIRYVIEQVIANFKTWRIMHTDYRRPIETFNTTISAVIGLHFWRAA